MSGEVVAVFVSLDVVTEFGVVSGRAGGRARAWRAGVGGKVKLLELFRGWVVVRAGRSEGGVVVPAQGRWQGWVNAGGLRRADGVGRVCGVGCCCCCAAAVVHGVLASPTAAAPLRLLFHCCCSLATATRLLLLHCTTLLLLVAAATPLLLFHRYTMRCPNRPLLVIS